jgi:heptosyltransferase I
MKIAIVKLSALGDIVHAMIVLQFIKQHNQKIEIDWIVEEEYKQLLESNKDIHQIHTVKLKKAKKSKSFFMLANELIKLRKFGPYDQVIDFQGLIKSAIISRLIPSIITLGFDRYSIRESIASIFYNKVFNSPYSGNIILRNVGLINFALSINIDKKQIDHKLPFLFSTKNEYNFNLDSSKNNILIVPGASFKAKIYPAIKYAELVNNVDANFFMIWASSDEKKITYEIKAHSKNIKVLERLNLSSLISFISQVDLVIGSDTGPTHMSWALNVPSITLYGATPGYRNSYQTLDNKVIESESEVNPLKINKTDFSIKDIEVSEIVKITRKLLRGK